MREFIAAKTNPNAVTRDRYIFRPDGSFQFAFDFVNLPDLNYNNPIVRAHAIDRARFWMELGMDGFRCDIAAFTPSRRAAYNGHEELAALLWRAEGD